MTALEELERYLDTVLSAEPSLAAKSAAIPSKRAQGKSRKWMREASRRLSKANLDAAGLSTGAFADRRLSTASISSVDSLSSSIADDEEDEDTAEMFRMLEVKRMEREKQMIARQEELARQAAVMKAEQDARRKIEMARIEKIKAKEREEELAYKEYCQIGANRRLQQLSFKFRWQAADNAPQKAPAIQEEPSDLLHTANL